MATVADAVAVSKAPRNWWKIGFFVMLFLFEGAREWAVIAAYEPPKISTSTYVGRALDLTTATGSWKRIDGGSELSPNSVRITCWQREGKCYESTYSVFNGYVGTPELDVFDAQFSDDGVTYENETPECVKYSVRIDLGVEKVLATRLRKPNQFNQACNAVESKISMILADGFDVPDQTRDHILPVFWMIRNTFGF